MKVCFWDYTTVGRIAQGIGKSFMYLMHQLALSGVDAEPCPKGSGLYYQRNQLKERIPFLTFEVKDNIDWDTI